MPLDYWARPPSLISWVSSPLSLSFSFFHPSLLDQLSNHTLSLPYIPHINLGCIFLYHHGPGCILYLASFECPDLGREVILLSHQIRPNRAVAIGYGVFCLFFSFFYFVKLAFARAHAWRCLFSILVLSNTLLPEGRAGGYNGTERTRRAIGPVTDTTWFTGRVAGWVGNIEFVVSLFSYHSFTHLWFIFPFRQMGGGLAWLWPGLINKHSVWGL